MKGVFFTKQFLWMSLLFLTSLSTLVAQNEANPFELQHRLSKKQSIGKATEEVPTNNNPFDIESRQTSDTLEIEQVETVNVEAANPFDIKRIKPSGSKASPEEITPEILPEKKADKTPVDTKSGFLFWTILGMMVLLALLVTLYRSLISNIYRAFTNENILKLLQREQSVFIAIPYLFLYILFFISAGIFVFQIAHYYQTISFDFSNMAYCILGVFGFFLLKHFILKIIEFVFPIAKEIKQYNFTIIIFSIILGILLIPFNIFIAFAQDSLTFYAIVAGLLTILAVYLFRALRGIFIGSKFLAFHKFHFFMYLCAVEIAPLLILMKLLLNGANIH